MGYSRSINCVELFYKKVKIRFIKVFEELKKKLSFFFVRFLYFIDFDILFGVEIVFCIIGMYW